MKKLIVGLVQQSCTADRDANMEKSAAGIRKAVSKGAELIVLQELHLGPYFCQTENPAYFDLAEPIPGPASEAFGSLARELNVVIVASIFERRAAGLYHNTAVVLDKDGSIAGKYRKMHIPDDPGYYEKYYFTPGDLGFRPIATSAGRLGVLVCWDQWYPEAARLMALSGAELLIYPTAIGWEPGESEVERSADAGCMDDYSEVPRNRQRTAGDLRKPGRVRTRFRKRRPAARSSGETVSLSAPRANFWRGQAMTPMKCLRLKSTWRGLRWSGATGLS